MTIISSKFCTIVLLQLAAVVQSLIIRRHYHDGILYEDYAADSDNVRYTVTSGEGWDDLDSLVATYNLRGKAMFCTRGPGAWLLYQDANYQYGTMRQLKLVYGEHCVSADNVNSLQPLGAAYVSIEDASAVVVFSERHFASKGLITTDMIAESIKSAIFVGIGNWTVHIAGIQTCVIAPNSGDVCFLEDIQNSFSDSTDQLLITKGCEPDEIMEEYKLQTCYTTGFHEITYDFDFTRTAMKDICFGHYDPQDQVQKKFLTLVNLWKKRMSPPSNLNPPNTAPNTEQRLTVLNEMVHIMGKTCPGISPSFLEIVKQIYLLHIKNGELWNTTVAPNGIPIEQSHAKWLRAQAFVMDCGNFNEEVETGCYPEDISEMKDEKEVATIEDFLNGESYDFVIEHVWLLLNYISTYCNFHMGFKNNDWSIFPLLFKRDFLYPLQDQWKHPGIWSTYYPLMFNGFDMENERKAMISCVQAAIKVTPFYDPLARPPGFYFGNSTAEKDIIGGVTPAPSPAPDPDPSRHRRQPVISNSEGNKTQEKTTGNPTRSSEGITTIPTTTPSAVSASTKVPIPQTNSTQTGAELAGQVDGAPRRLRRRRKKGKRRRLLNLLMNNMAQIQTPSLPPVVQT